MVEENNKEVYETYLIQSTDNCSQTAVGAVVCGGRLLYKARLPWPLATQGVIAVMQSTRPGSSQNREKWLSSPNPEGSKSQTCLTGGSVSGFSFRNSEMNWRWMFDIARL